jgi:PAS domain S-box-containing protein
VGSRRARRRLVCDSVQTPARTGAIIHTRPRVSGPDTHSPEIAMQANSRTIASLVGAALLVVAVVVLSFWAFSQIETSSAARKQTFGLIIRADALLSDLADAETGQRDYLLTGDEAFLKPYSAVRDRIARELSELRSLASSPDALKRLDAMAALLTAKLAQLSQTIELRRRQEMSALLAAEASGQGRRMTNSFRAETRSLIRIEEGELARQDVEIQSSMRRLFALIVTASVLAFLLGLSFAWMIYRESQRQLDDLLHVETRRLLEIQEETNRQLQETNFNLHVSEERLAVTLNSIDDAVIATDAEGRVTLLNPLAERLTGWTRVDAFRRPVEEVFQLIDADTRQPYPVPVRETLAHGTTLSLANHTIVIARDGRECHIADSCAPILDRRGQVVGAVLVFRDVTERKRLDQAMHDKNAELEHARALADKANLAKSEFLSSMSHELRTPLSAILGFAQLMESASPQPTVSQKRSIEQIIKAGWYLLDLINEILDLALIESGKLSLSLEPISLTEVLHECQVMMEPQAQKRGVGVAFPRFGVPYFVKADRTRLKQVLINLLSNAVKYNKVGGTLVVDCITGTPGRIRIRVKDTGEGLSPEKLARLFEPFNRLGQGTSSEEGTGIGLVVCKRLVELMGGAIGVESAVGKGSVFWIEFDLTAAPQLAAGTTAPPAAAPPVEAGTRVRTLLYVEDNPANLMLVEDLIARRPDIHLLSAVDGIRGIEMAHVSRPDVILMDINLPDVSGIEVLRILTEDPATAHIPVVALSANAMPRDIEKGLKAGFFRYLTKPIKVNEFMDTLDVALKFAQPRAVPTKSEEKA